MHPMPPLCAVVALVAPGAMALLLAPALAGASPDLRAQVEAAVGAPVRLDPRLRPPACPEGFRFTPWGRTVEILCPATGWRLVAPVGRAPETPASGPAIQRGERVTVALGLPGLELTVEAVAERAGRPGDRIVVRNRLTGARFPATVGADGTLVVGRSPVVGR